MESIIKLNWDTVDYDKLHTDYITMPDGTKRLIEMSMLHWYWVQFMEKEGFTPLTGVIQDTIEILAEGLGPDEDYDEEFDHLLRTGILAWGRNWIHVSEGK